MKKQRGIARSLVGFLIAVLILAAAGVLGNFTGIFYGMEGFTEMIKINPEAILKLVIVIAFLASLNFLIQACMGFFKGKTGRTKTLATVISSLVKYGIVLVAFCWGLTILGVNVSTIFASVGIVALILGFGAESLVADVVTGVFILFENQFNVGDIIEVDGFRGTVETMGIRTIGIKDAGSNIKIINNSDLKNIINRSQKSSVAISQIAVSYGTDLEELEKKMPEMLTEIKNKNTDIFTDTITYLGVEELADSGVVLKFVADVKEKDIFAGRRRLNKELKCAFDKAHIEIPFPQLDIHNK